jgi:hypothetical protein
MAPNNNTSKHIVQNRNMASEPRQKCSRVCSNSFKRWTNLRHTPPAQQENPTWQVDESCIHRCPRNKHLPCFQRPRRGRGSVSSTINRSSSSPKAQPAVRFIPTVRHYDVLTIQTWISSGTNSSLVICNWPITSSRKEFYTSING